MKGIHRLSVAITFVAVLLFCSPAYAHPELIFYVDTSATVHTKENKLFLDYYIAKSDQIAFSDLALTEGNIELLAEQQCTSAKKNFELSIGNYKIPFSLNSSQGIEELASTGAGLWIECRFFSEIDIFGITQFTWKDQNYADKPGHHEFNIGLSNSPSSNLTDFTLVPALLDQRSDNFMLTFPEDESEAFSQKTTEPDLGNQAQTIKPSPSPKVVLRQKAVTTEEQSWLTKTSNRYFRTLNPTPIVVAIGAFIAFLLGAIHSIAPGHGKSIMAVMALAEGGKRKEIIRLGLAMGITHTIGVLVLGTLFILGASSIPRSVIPALGILSGILISAVGSYYIARFLRHQHQHRHKEDHHHEVDIGAGRIALLGIVGGMVPTPTAITILVGTAALGSAWYGVLLVGSYGIGMTSILIFAGKLVEKLYQWANKITESPGIVNKIVNSAPLLAACIQVMAGVFLVVISYQALV